MQGIFEMAVLFQELWRIFGCDVIDVMIDAMILDTQLEVLKTSPHAFDRPNASNNKEG